MREDGEKAKVIGLGGNFTYQGESVDAVGDTAAFQHLALALILKRLAVTPCQLAPCLVGVFQDQSEAVPQVSASLGPQGQVLRNLGVFGQVLAY